MPAISVSNLHRWYGEIHAVAGIDLTVEHGEVFALLGPNGAGKTTTVEILEGYRTRDDGVVMVLGTDPARADRRFREQIGIVPQSGGVDLELSVEETVRLYASLYPNPLPVGEALALTGLTERRTTRVKALSGGMRRRLDLAVGIVANPEMLFLDEPTTGFDPEARRGAWTLIDGLRSLGKTILLTTHYMDEAQHLADRVAVIAAGEIVAEGDPATLGGRHVARATISFRLPEGAPVPPMAPPGDADGVVRTQADDPTRLLHELTGWAVEHDVALLGLQVTRPTLEDVYLELVGREEP